MTDATHSASGRCLCGAITFHVLGELRDVCNCHCARCRQFTGHHMAATATDVKDLRIDDAHSNLQWYRPVPEAGYAFCKTCGSSLFWQSTSAPDRISVCAGTLDPPTHLRTTQACWVSEASDYHPRPDVPERDTE
ncbi:MAG: GFA family protein [Marmoricola sp.]